MALMGSQSCQLSHANNSILAYLGHVLLWATPSPYLRHPAGLLPPASWGTLTSLRPEDCSQSEVFLMSMGFNGIQWDSIGSPKISQKFTTGFKTGCIYSFVRLSAVVVLSPSTSPDPQDSQPVPWSQKNPKDASQHLPYKSQYQGRSSPRSPKSQAKWELELSHTISCRSCNWLTSRVKIMWFS